MRRANRRFASESTPLPASWESCTPGRYHVALAIVSGSTLGAKASSPPVHVALLPLAAARLAGRRPAAGGRAEPRLRLAVRVPATRRRYHTRPAPPPRPYPGEADEVLRDGNGHNSSAGTRGRHLRKPVRHAISRRVARAHTPTRTSSRLAPFRARAEHRCGPRRFAGSLSAPKQTANTSASPRAPYIDSRCAWTSRCADGRRRGPAARALSETPGLGGIIANRFAASKESRSILRRPGRVDSAAGPGRAYSTGQPRSGLGGGSWRMLAAARRLAGGGGVGWADPGASGHRRAAFPGRLRRERAVRSPVADMAAAAADLPLLGNSESRDPSRGFIVYRSSPTQERSSRHSGVRLPLKIRTPTPPRCIHRAGTSAQTNRPG